MRDWYDPPRDGDKGYEARYYIQPTQYEQPHYITPKRKRFAFSGREIRELLISVGVLSLAFGIVLGGGIDTIASNPLLLLISVPIAALAVTTGFLFHELSHKFLAQRYGCWAEFRSWTMGLILALVTAFFGFLFAAPGAVHIEGRMTREQYGKISAAGPTSNIAVAVAFLPLYLFSTQGSMLELVGFYVYLVNTVLAGFNLIPIPPFDGQKIWTWSKPVYITMVAIVLSLYISRYFF